MTIICSICSYENQDVTEFCQACGAELKQEFEELNLASTEIQSPIENPIVDNSPQDTTQTQFPYPISIQTATTKARLISKQPGSPIPEFLLDSNNAIVGRFDPDSGPVDVDLEGFIGEDTVSRNHAEIYYEGGQWKVKDLGSTNGIFIKYSGQTRFAARITIPEILNPGDEVAFGKIRFIFQIP